MNDKYNSKELATKAVMHALMKAGIKVHLATPEMFAKDLSFHRAEFEKQIGDNRISKLHYVSRKINKWVHLKGNVKNDDLNIQLPYRINNKIKTLLGKSISTHGVDLFSVRHIFKNHGINGRKLTDKNIPLRKEDLKLIPFIMTAPDIIEKGSMDNIGRESIKFKKYLSNGFVVVVEKETKNNPHAMGTITMWADVMPNVSDARKMRPLNSTSETVVIGLDDIAKIIKDAENAIREDVKNQVDKQINYFYGIERTESVGIKEFESNDITNICRKGNTLYGWTFNGEIYLTPEGINPDTPVHEYTHLWANAMMIKNPDEWAIVKSLLSEKQEWQGVVNDPLYKSISDDDDRVASETLARLSGKSNMQLLAHYAEDTLHKQHISDERSLINKMLNSVTTALKKFWGWVAHTVFHIPQLQSVQQVTDRILYDLVNSTPLTQEKELDDQPQYSIIKEMESEIEISLKGRIIDIDDPDILKKNPFDDNRISRPTIIKQGFGYAIRCKIDGIQQSASTLSSQEQKNYLQLLDSGDKKKLSEYLTTLAEKYFGGTGQSENLNKGLKR